MSRKNTTRAGNQGCPCIDTSATLASLTTRSCTTSDEQDGVLLTVNGPCVPYSYGSSVCRRYDLIHDQACQFTSSEGEDIPTYCIRSFCYVDAMACMSSTERVYRSNYFPADSGVDIFYSYSTCGSSAEDWLQSQTNALEKVSMTAITAAYNIMPWVYKRNYDGDVPVVPGNEYYDNSVPHEGVHINFVKALQDISDGDFTVKYVHGSRASRLVHPSSPGTAAVQDVADGLVDIAIGPIWITGGRLKMTSFTMPIHHDRTVLVIPRPGSKSSLSVQTQKVLDPFTYGVWAFLLAVITVTALMSVWFSTKGARKGRGRKMSSSVLARLAVDEFLQKGIFFCSAGVEQDEGASLPHKLLMFGFAFFILIVVSAYVANLAAFLTRNYSSNYVGKIDEVVSQGLKICAHPALEDDLILAHPGANFVFNREGKELYGLVEDYKAGKCDVLAVGKMDSLGDLKLIDLFCEEDLVYTESLIIENPVGFPIRSELASGFSYWMYQGEKYHGISVETSQEAYDAENQREASCNVMLSEQDAEANEYAQIKVQNLFFPIMFFLGFAILAVVLQLYHQWLMKKEKQNPVAARRVSSLMGRKSTLNLFASSRNVGISIDSEKQDEDEICGVSQSIECPISNSYNITEGCITGNSASSLAKGTLICDTVCLDSFQSNGTNNTAKKKVSFDGFPDNDDDRTMKKKVSFSVDIDSNFEDDDELSNDGVTLSQLDSGVLDKLDDFIACYQTMKRRRMLTGTR